ncbi:MAG: hypothetical protein OEX18_04535 [Candidatus Krumholzibacteria bacterium]|nr:hypothetical protein [Candidatus Krumholzibacteria bacterium]MDH4336526.1 hypothetical protein [Candidatus Krumholzibacteria bacterium]MDH5269607.1 hypothetical protein [Candidatus Krumholzibacteria bacterium]
MSFGGIAGGAAGASVARRRRQIIAAFRAAGATSPARAVPESSLELRGHLVFRTMQKRGIIVRTPDGRLYLNEAVEAAVNRMRHLTVAAILLIMLIGIAWVFGMKGKAP